MLSADEKILDKIILECIKGDLENLVSTLEPPISTTLPSSALLCDSARNLGHQSTYSLSISKKLSTAGTECIWNALRGRGTWKVKSTRFASCPLGLTWLEKVEGLNELCHLPSNIWATLTSTCSLNESWTLTKWLWFYKNK